MCRTGSSLDYVVALHNNSNEIRVLRIKQTGEKATIKDYKVIDKDQLLQLKGKIYVDCAKTEVYKGVNTYNIGVLGSYFHANGISSYYLAKFSTKYNLTEYFIKSEDPQTMEIPKGVSLDWNN